MKTESPPPAPPGGFSANLGGSTVLSFAGHDGSPITLDAEASTLILDGRLYKLQSDQLARLITDFALIGTNQRFGDTLVAVVGRPPEQFSRSGDGDLSWRTRADLEQVIREARSELRRGIAVTRGRERLAPTGSGRASPYSRVPCSDMALAIWSETQVWRSTKRLYEASVKKLAFDAIQIEADSLGRPQWQLPPLSQWKDWQPSYDPIAGLRVEALGTLLGNSFIKLNFLANQYSYLGCHLNGWPSAGAGGLGAIGGKLGGGRTIKRVCTQGPVILDLPSGTVEIPDGWKCEVFIVDMD